MGSYTGAQFIDDVARRLRDTTNTGYSRTQVLRFLNAGQDLINMRLALLQDEFTLTTESRALYQLTTAVPRILTVREADGRELANVPWDRLIAQDTDWIRRFAPRAELWSQIGRDLLAITPIPERGTSLTVVHVKFPAPLADNSTPWELPDEHKALLTDLAEAILLFRSREFNALQEALNRAAPKLGMEDVSQILRRGGQGRMN